MKNVFFFAVIAVLALTSCSNASEGFDTSIQTLETSKIVDYGNGVYYFKCTTKNFGTNLSLFLSDSTKTLISITGDATSMANHGADNGYWVVVKK